MILSNLTTSLGILAVIGVAITVIWIVLRGGEKTKLMSAETDAYYLAKLSLNIHDGKLKLGKWQVLPTDTLADLKSIIPEPQFELIHTYSDWKTYRVILSDKLVVAFLFREEILQHTSLYAHDEKNGPFETNSTEAAEHLLAHLGGEKKYWWGHVVLEVDTKGGSISVILAYTR